MLIQKYPNTQIQHMTRCQKDPTCGTFLKRGLFRDIKNNSQTKKKNFSGQKRPKFGSNLILNFGRCLKFAALEYHHSYSRYTPKFSH